MRAWRSVGVTLAAALFVSVPLACSVVAGIDKITFVECVHDCADSAVVETSPCRVDGCTTFPQCGCESGKNCVVPQSDMGAGTTACIAAGSKVPGSVCSKSEDCAVGSWCRLGVCRPFCGSDADCASFSKRAVCEDSSVTDASGVSKTIPNAKTCKARCDALGGEAACPSGQGCYVYSLADAWLTQCVSAGEGTGNGACATDTLACAAGYRCTGLGGDCRAYCKVGDGTCGSGTTCQPLETTAKIDGVEVGTCRTECDPRTPATACGSAMCMVYGRADGSGYTDCTEKVGTKPVGSSCTAIGDCVAGAICDHGVCSQWCRAGGSDCGAGETCALYKTTVKDSTGASTQWGRCVKTCEPTNASSCGTKGSCQVFGSGADAYTDCVPAGVATVNGKCTERTDCAAGGVCSSVSLCKKYCRVGTSDCGAGTCLAYTDHPKIAGVEYGTCADNCNPISPAASCGPTNNCLVYGGGDEPFYSTCAPAGGSAAGASCAANPFACAPGENCPQSKVCSKFCRVGATDCGTGTCRTYSDHPTLAGVEYGFCG
ncbi:MAG: hypothetical protein ACXVEF_06015 [Polyangiales bacterium]